MSPVTRKGTVKTYDGGDEIPAFLINGGNLSGSLNDVGPLGYSNAVSRYWVAEHVELPHLCSLVPVKFTR